VAKLWSIAGLDIVGRNDLWKKECIPSGCGVKKVSVRVGAADVIFLGKQLRAEFGDLAS
jgi:hypothetical protein